METPKEYPITASKIIPEKKMGVLISKENRGRVSELSNGEDHQLVDEQIIDSETPDGESAFITDSETPDGESAFNRGSGVPEREKTRVSSTSSVSCQSVGDNANGFSEENKDEINSTGGYEKGGGENNFGVGDFVWGKFKTHMWWPGRVSGLNEGRVSVSFFGNGSCSSCSPSELLPFADNFCEISKVSSSKSFVNAVYRAVDELSRLVESNMSCKCASRMVENQGVIIPEVDSHRLSIPKYEPKVLLGQLTDLATKGDFLLEGALEIAVLKSWLSAFYYFKGGYEMPVYCEPCHVEGLEDADEKEENGVKKNGEVSVHLRGPLSTPPGSRGSRKRKEKSVAELILPEENENTDQKRKKKRKEKSAKLVSGKRKEIHVGDDEVLGSVFTPRERKKSKYLSPPYTDLTTRFGNSSSFKMEWKVEQEKKKLPEVNWKVEELLSEIHFAAVDPFYLSEKGSFVTVQAFVAALRGSTYLHGSNYKTLHKCTSSRSPKKELSPLKLAKEENEAACSEDDLISDAGLIGQKVKTMASILENCHSRLAAEDKSSLKEDMKLLKERVEAVTEKVRAMAKNTSS